MSFGHPSSGTSESFVSGNFGNGVKLVYGGEYGYINPINYTNFTTNQWMYPQNLGSQDQTFKGIFGNQQKGQLIFTYSNSAYRLALQMTTFSSGNASTGNDRYSAENTVVQVFQNNENNCSNK